MGETNSKSGGIRQPHGTGILKSSVGDELFGEFVNGKLSGYFIHWKRDKINYWIYKQEGSKVGTYDHSTRETYDWIQKTSRVRISNVSKVLHLYFNQQCDAFKFYNEIPILNEGYQDGMQIITFNSGTLFEKKLFISPETEADYDTHVESTAISSKIFTD